MSNKKIDAVANIVFLIILVCHLFLTYMAYSRSTLELVPAQRYGTQNEFYAVLPVGMTYVDIYTVGDIKPTIIVDTCYDALPVWYPLRGMTSEHFLTVPAMKDALGTRCPEDILRLEAEIDGKSGVRVDGRVFNPVFVTVIASEHFRLSVERGTLITFYPIAFAIIQLVIFTLYTLILSGIVNHYKDNPRVEVLELS